jgi:hypothetical protein
LLVGTILLLPGLCALIYALPLLSTGFKFNGKFDIGLVVIWVICLLIGVLGVALITLAVRGARRS